jgi:glycosyltransferase 2 family protein
VERLKKNFVLALGLGVAVYLALAIVSGLDDLRNAFTSFHWSLLPVIFGLVAFSYVVRFVRWSYYLKLLRVSLPSRMNVAIFAAGLSMTVSPGKFGEVLKSVFIRQVNGAPIARTAPAVVAERMTDATGMVTWGLLGALAFSFGPGALLLFLALTAAGVAVLRSKRLSLLAERVLLKLPLLHRLAPHLGDFHGASNELLAMRPLIVGTTISFCSWGIEILAVYLCVVGIGAGTPFLVVVFIFAVGSIAGGVSMLPGGIGAAEAGMVGMFGTVAGLSGGTSVALTFVIRLATLWFATLIGVMGLLLVRRIIGEPADVIIAERKARSGSNPEP